MADEQDHAKSTRRPTQVEWPTIGVLIAIGGGFAAVASTHARLPSVVTIALLGVLAAWYGSLRHEVVHGHPTPWGWVNTMIVAVPLGLAEPFWQYRDEHLRHHASEDLTDPTRDPESQYLTRSAWEGARPVVRVARTFNTTLAGRLIVGPWFATAASAASLARRWNVAERRWSIARFLIADAAVLVGVHLVGLPVWQYVLGAGYVGTSLTLVRSYAEHRAVADGSRTAVVRSRGFWALLFLNNNLHVTHHHRPGLAWYRIPAVHAASDANAQAALGAGLYRGYGEIFRRYLFHPVSRVVDPLERDRSVAAA